MSQRQYSGTSPSRRTALALRYALFSLAYLAMISWFSSHAAPGTSGSGPLAQIVINIYHVSLYAGLGFFILQTISRGDALTEHRWTRAAFTFAATGVVALLDEWHQSYVPGRDPALFDVLLDLAGVVALLLVCALGTAQKPRPGASSASLERDSRS